MFLSNHLKPSGQEHNYPLRQTRRISMDSWHKSHNARVQQPTAHHPATEMCAYAHISVTKRRTAGHPSNAWGDL